MAISDFQAGQIQAKRAAGMSIFAIQMEMKLARNTVRNVLRNMARFEAGVRPKRRVIEAVARRREALRRVALQNKFVRSPGCHPVVVQRRYPTIPALVERLRKQFPGINDWAVSRDLKILGLAFRVRPKVVCNSPENNAKRLKFALANRNTRLRRYVFSDECWINDNDNTHRKEVVDLSDPTSRPSTRLYQKRPKTKIMVWGAIGLNFKSKLIFLNRNVKSETYIADILEKAKAELKEVPHLLFMQDNATPHVSRASKKWLNDNGIRLVENWPPHSPHMNPIEHLWALIHREIALLRPKTDAQLEKIAQRVWDGISMSTINSYVRGFKSSLEKCIRLNGEPW